MHLADTATQSNLHFTTLQMEANAALGVLPKNCMFFVEWKRFDAVFHTQQPMFFALNKQQVHQINSNCVLNCGEVSFQFLISLRRSWKRVIWLDFAIHLLTLTVASQDPFSRLSKEFKEKLTVDERREVREFLDATDAELFALELHEILLLKTDSTSQNSYSSQWE